MAFTMEAKTHAIIQKKNRTIESLEHQLSATQAELKEAKEIKTHTLANEYSRGCFDMIKRAEAAEKDLCDCMLVQNELQSMYNASEAMLSSVVKERDELREKLQIEENTVKFYNEITHKAEAENQSLRTDKASLISECERLKEELEHERVRLAGCGVAAMQNTEDSVKDRATDGDYGWSASYSDVCKAVDREMKYRSELAECRRAMEAIVSTTNDHHDGFESEYWRVIKIAREALGMGEAK